MSFVLNNFNFSVHRPASEGSSRGAVNQGKFRIAAGRRRSPKIFAIPRKPQPQTHRRFSMKAFAEAGKETLFRRGSA